MIDHVKRKSSSGVVVTMDDQQEQARTYFNESAREWQAETEGRADEFNVIEARNRAVLDIASRFPTASAFLDVGCGTGQLAIEVAKRGNRSVGLDFAPDMIRIAKENNAKQSTGALFVCSSFFEAQHGPASYDVISAQGFIEYISLDELEVFLGRCSAALRAGGSLALGSRNRLFNVASLNAFTKIEMELGTIDRLIGEAICFEASAPGELFTDLVAHERIDPQPLSHPGTGIIVDIRYQFSPADLIKRAKRYGFAPNAIYPIHFHALPISFKREHPNLHIEIAKLAGLKDHRLVPYSSSFVLDLQKYR
jgi:2-polyprenyl-3-methyl-5-hydroxy-6-metoxy-1,4-benzoquinol methylase